jgi:vacuolar-type H+-ATPase subunit E/Vma4
VEIFPKDESLERVETLIDEFISAVQSHVLDSLDTELADALTETLKNVSEMLALKQEKSNLNVSAFTKHAKAVFNMLIRCLGVYSSYRL